MTLATEKSTTRYFSACFTTSMKTQKSGPVIVCKASNPAPTPTASLSGWMAGALNLDLWYSTNNEWLALESEVQGGRILRYERM